MRPMTHMIGQPWAMTRVLVPTDKVNFDPIQNQIDEIVSQIHHTAGAITAVVPVIGSGQSSIRYTLPADLDGSYDVTVRVKARVQVNEFANISGNLRISVDGGNGLNSQIPPMNHGYGHAHEGVFHFVRRGLVIAPGLNVIDFAAEVTGQNPPDVHFIETENMTITNTSLVNANNVNPFIAEFARTGNPAQVPDDKLHEVRDWARESATAADTPPALELGPFLQSEIDALPADSEATFFYRALVQKDPDGTLAYVGGSWRQEVAPPAFAGMRYRGEIASGESIGYYEPGRRFDSVRR